MSKFLRFNRRCLLNLWTWCDYFSQLSPQCGDNLDLLFVVSNEFKEMVKIQLVGVRYG